MTMSESSVVDVPPLPTAPLPDGVVADNVGRDVLALIRAYGVDTVFGIPGTHNLEFYRHLAPLGIRAVTTRHEQGAGYAADGWSQQTGLPGVVITTSGPGLLNVLSAAGTAYAESRPLLILSPGAPLGRERADRGALHETKDPVGASGSIVEWARRVTSGTQAVQAVHEAFELFRHQRPRPIHIEIPLDVLEGPSDCTPELLHAWDPRRPRPADAAAIAAAAEVLAGATAPLIIAGGGAVPAAADVTRLAELLDAPVLTTMNGKGVLPESHPLALGAELRLASGRELVASADALLVIGSKVGEAETWFEPLRPTGPVVRVDIEEDQLTSNLPCAVGVHADARSAVPQLTAALAERGVSAGARGGTGRVTAALPALRTEAATFAPVLDAITTAVAAVLPTDAIVSGDSSQVTYLSATSAVRVEQPGGFLYMATYATLGYGLPAAIGAKVAVPDRPVVCLLGDGALMFSVQELVTAVEQRLDLVVVCVDNGGYGEIKQNELDRGIAPVGVDLVQPDWPVLATAFGGHGSRIAAADELGPAVTAAIRAGGVQLVHVPLAVFEEAGR